MGDHRLEEWLSFLSLSIIIFDVFVLKMFLYSSIIVFWYGALSSPHCYYPWSHITQCVSTFPGTRLSCWWAPLVWVRQRQTTDLIWKYHTPFLIPQSIQTWNTDTRQIYEDTSVCLSSACSLSIAWLTLQDLPILNVSSSFISELDISDSCKIYCWVVSWKRVKWCCWC